ncbi:MAG: IclR family transcriptional regulator [Lacisediminihabitans sp.]
MQPVIRALKALKRIAAARQGITLQVLSDELNIPIASTHRLLADLLQEQYVVRSHDTRRYFLGPAARELGGHRETNATSRIVHPALARLASETGETVFITELIGSVVLAVSLVEGRHPLRLFVRAGQEMPLHAAASARVLLSELPEGEARALLSLSPITAFAPSTPKSVAEVLAHLPAIRARGYDICDDELDHDVWAVAAPIRDASGQIVAAMTLAAPAVRAAGEVRTRYLELVVNAARSVTAGLVGDDGSSATRAPETR